VALFGAGHVLANAGAAQLAMDAAGSAAGPVAALLATAQYLGGAFGALVVFAAAGAGTGEPAAVDRGLLVAAAIAVAGAAASALARQRARGRGGAGVHAAASQRASWRP
jgi:hypothetical protein